MPRHRDGGRDGADPPQATRCALNAVNARGSKRTQPGWTMNFPSLRALLCAALAALVPACMPSTFRAPPADTGVAHVTRDAAIDTARSDAAATFQARWVTSVAAHSTGAYWLVELRTQTGAGLRYTISRHDGSIRERSSFQRGFRARLLHVPNRRVS